MSKIPTDLKYSAEHEWVKITGDTAIIGITDHAQSELGDIVFVEMPVDGAQIAQNSDFGVVESVKTVSNLYAPLSGTVSAVNTQLTEHADLVNKDPYGEGWIIKLKDFKQDEIDALLDAAQYKEKIGE